MWGEQPHLKLTILLMYLTGWSSITVFKQILPVGSLDRASVARCLTPAQCSISNSNSNERISYLWVFLMHVLDSMSDEVSLDSSGL